ncbi:hypothetical protein GGU10DRAFT_378310 [Lentinula aff. detonsa]|uniref:Uncharacterized protein n=1 Tax=Lentinula aff. detonsa TaxID=2804958 RepID=A0AA38KMV5_9AGAR|nr:hypothetical protein GGU10DRAFT_378310 [Lentinula aff. detonsa]
MEKLEEEAAQEAEEIRLAEERKLAEERQSEEERQLEEEKRLAEEQRKEEEKLVAAAAEKDEEEQITKARSAAFQKLVEDNQKEKEKATKELEQQWEPTTSAKVFKSRSVVSNNSVSEGGDKRNDPTPRGVKRKRAIKIIAKSGNTSDPDGDYNPDLEQGNKNPPPSPGPSQAHPVCSHPHDNQHKCAQFVTSNNNDVAGLETTLHINGEANGLRWMMRLMKDLLRE